MKFKLISTTFSEDRVIDNNTYQNSICLIINSDLIPNFFKEIIVISDNKQTGFEVDIQRQKAIDDYMLSINN